MFAQRYANVILMSSKRCPNVFSTLHKCYLNVILMSSKRYPNVC